MKISLITSIIRNNKLLLPALTIAGNIMLSPFALATVYNNTVDLNTQNITDNDSIITGDSTAISSTTAGNAPLQLGTGSVNVEITTSAPGKHIYGANLANQMDNNFGNGSLITINQTTTGAASYYTNGVLLSNQTNMSATGLELSINSTTLAKGIIGNNNNIIDLGNRSKISVTTSAGRAEGIILGQNGQLNANAIEISAKSQGTATGIYSSGANVDVGTGSKITVESSNAGGTSYAINVAGNTEVIADNLEIIGINTNGILAGGTSNIDLGSNSSISVSGNQSSAISFNGTDVNLTADRLTIHSTGDFGYGMNLNNGSHNVNLGSHSSIITEGANAHGIWQIGRNDATFTADALTIHTKGLNANAIDIRKGSATIGAGSVLTAEKEGTLVVYANSGAIANATVNDSKLISGGSFAASAQGASATVNLNNVEANVDRNGSTAYALWAVNSGKIDANNLLVNAAEGVYGMVANGAGRITLAGDIVINTQSGVAMISSNANSAITGSGRMAINGQVVAQDASLLDLVMTNGSILNGAVHQYTNGIANLNMDNTRWSFDDDSSVNNLTLTNNSIVTFDTTGDGLLTINNLSGNGLFVMRTDIVGGSGDLIDITGTTTNSHSVKVINSGSDATDGTETLTIITTADGSGNFGLTNQVELGGYLYDLEKTGNNWQLYSSGRAITSAADASASILNASYLMNYAETQTLLQRMGDLRQDGKSGNVWVRAFHGSFDSFADGKLSGFDMNYQGIQLGVDKASAFSNGKLYTGLFAGLSDSSQDYAMGDGKLKSQSAGVYGSYMFSSGAYLDAVVKYQHHSNKLNVVDTQGNSVNGKGTSNGLAVSLEGGHRFHLNTEKSGVYVEPQLQITYSWQDGSTVDNSNGLKVDLDSYHSLLGRAGAIIGYDVNKMGKAPVNIYFKNSWLHEFKGQTNYKLNGSKETLSFKGGAWVSGVGVSTQLNNNHALFLDMEKTTGKKFNQDQINAGYRYSF